MLKLTNISMLLTVFTCMLVLQKAETHISKRSYSDQSVHGYLTEVLGERFGRTCWWNEVCKEEFQSMFRCKCPHHSFCRSPGRYYNAYCSMTNTGYIWTQPTWDWGP